MKYIIALIVILIAILYLYKQQENLDASGLSNEALQNIASVYGNKDGTLTFNNVTNTRNLEVGGTAHFKGKNTGTWFPYSDGKNYIRGQTQIDGEVFANQKVEFNNTAHFKGDTWFPYSDGKNYIRGSTQFDNGLVEINNNLKVNGNINAINFDDMYAKLKNTTRHLNNTLKFLRRGPGEAELDWAG
jgi:hypothetical protein